MSELTQVGNIEDIGGNNWGPTFLSPAEYWVAFASNVSAYGDTALYATPTSNGCAHSFFNGSSVTTYPVNLRTGSKGTVRLWSLLWMDGSEILPRGKFNGVAE